MQMLSGEMNSEADVRNRVWIITWRVLSFVKHGAGDPDAKR